MSGLDQLAAILRSAATAAQDALDRRAAAAAADPPWLMPPAVVRVGALSLDLPVVVEEVRTGGLFGRTALALRIGGPVPEGARVCRLTLDCSADDRRTVAVSIDGHRIATFGDQNHDER